jgi:ABC-type Zn2+ transport system substrate-binding protein/surface adhesin
MNSQEVNALTNGFLTQLRGIFTGLEKLPAAFEELQQREQAVSEKEAKSAALDNALLDKEWKSAELDQHIAAKTAELNRIAATVAEKLKDEEARLRAEIAAKLEPLHAEHAAVSKQLDDKVAVLAALRT